MKNLKILSTMVLAGLFMATNVFAGNRSFKGKWRCTVSGYEMELAPTSYGFKTRNLKSKDWQHYDEIYYNHFSDADGNNFDWQDDSWNYSSYNGDKHMTFRPFQNDAYGNNNTYSDYYSPTSYTNNQWNDNEYDDNRYDYGNSHLVGSWHSNYNSGCLIIKSSGRKCIAVEKDRRNRWQDYRRVRSGIYKDRKGNKIRYIGRDRIQWTSHCGRYKEIYNRGRNYDRRGNSYRGNRNNRGGGYNSCSG